MTFFFSDLISIKWYAMIIILLVKSWCFFKSKLINIDKYFFLLHAVKQLKFKTAESSTLGFLILNLMFIKTAITVPQIEQKKPLRTIQKYKKNENFTIQRQIIIFY